MSETERDRMRKALEFIRDGYARGDINHVDFRVGAYKAALAGLNEEAPEAAFAERIMRGLSS